MTDVKTIAAALDAESAAITNVEPEEWRLVRTGRHGDNAGSYGQYFGTYDIAAGMLRDYTGYTLYPLVRMARSGKYTAAEMAQLFTEFDPAYSHYLGYSGLRKLGDFAERLRGAFPVASIEDIAMGLAALNRYANRLNAWNHHYFPWDLGEQFRYDSVPPEDRSYFDLSRIPSEAIGDAWIRMSWEPLGISVKVQLATFRNPELCRDVLGAAPFRVPQSHAMVTGKSIYAWTPILSTSPVAWREVIREAPFGRVRFSQNTGQKIIVQYGPTTEDLLAPVLGQIAVEDLGQIERLGAAIWESNYTTKDVVWLTVERL